MLHRASQQAAQSLRKRLRSLSPVALPQQLRKDFNLESEDEFSSSSPSPENLREASTLSSPLSLPLDPAYPQRDALLSPLILNLTPSPLLKVLDKPSPPTLNLTPSAPSPPPALPLDPASLNLGSSPGLENLRGASPPSSPPSLSMDTASPVPRDALLEEPEEEVVIVEEPNNWASEVELQEAKEKSSNIEQQKDYIKEMEEWRRKVVTTRRWQELEPRRVRAMEACVGRDETELSLDPGDIVTGVRPASWLKDSQSTGCWLEGTFEGWGRVGLVPESYVEYQQCRPSTEKVTKLGSSLKNLNSDNNN